METAVGKLTGISSKDTSKGMLYEFTVEGLGINKPLAYFPSEDEPNYSPDYSMQGKMVNVGYVLVEKPWERDGRSGVYKNYYLRQIAVVEGDTGTLDEVVAPLAESSAPNAPTTFTSAIVSPPSANGDDRQADIRRAVAFKGAIDMASAMAQAGVEVTENDILKFTNDFQNILESR